MKEHVFNYQLSTPAGATIKVVSPEAKTACRVNRDINGQLTLYANTFWDYPEIAWGDFSKNIQVVPQTGVVHLQFKE